MKPKLLDLFCGAGGAAMGYHRAGFDVVGIDNRPQPHYPFRFIQGDALNPPVDLSEFHAFHASPPCQRYTWAAKRWRKPRADLVGRTRELLRGRLYVIENVPGAPLVEPIRLCGVMFGLGVIRHRHFETPLPILPPRHRRHKPPVVRPAADDPSRMVQRSSYCTVAGNGGCSSSYRLDDWREAMGIDWMTKEEIVEAIPPAYTEWIGRRVMEVIR